MFPNMRRTDREITKDEIDLIMSKAEFGILSTIGANGYPYSIPFNFVVLGKKIYLHCTANAGHNKENIKSNPKVCFIVVGETEVMPDKFATLYESVVAFGSAQDIFDDEIKQTVLVKLIEKYSSDFMDSGLKYIEKLFDKTAVIEITIEHMTGKARKKTTKSNLEFFGQKEKVD